MRSTKWFARLHGNADMYLTAIGQRRIPYLSADALGERRDARVRRMVQHAAQYVPHYRDLFRARGIDPARIRTFVDLQQLPLLRKADVRANPNSFRSEAPVARYSIPFLTSGSSGAPLNVYHDPASLLANMAFGLRVRPLLERHGVNRAASRQLYIGYPGSTLQTVWRAHDEWAIAPMRPERCFVSLLEPIESVLSAINRFRPDVLYGYGTYLEHFARAVYSRGLFLHPPRAIVYGAEVMTEQGRRTIEHDLGIPVYSDYAAVEVFKLAFSCEANRGLHVHEDLSPTWIARANGHRANSGERGEVVVSNLVNHGTVLLNYCLGDVAAVSTTPCPCSRTLPMLTDLEGRVEDTIVLPDGRFLHPRAVWMIVRRRPSVIRYQLIQHSALSFELRLVTPDEATFAQVAPQISSDLEAIFGADSNVESTFHQDLPLGPGGKFRMVVALPSRVQ
ncbi:MAG: phenylacetate--CoA ligase family protein [Anaerolineae bacterium]|nr:phenylacetate--CoA ligase family protein [Gemmatimonadaceae bacterium]